MECIRTGCQVYIEEYHEYAYGDAFEMIVDGGPGNLVWVYAFHLCERGHTPINVPVKHFTIHTVDHWFDAISTSQNHNSTLIATSVTNHGYDGVPL